MTPTLRCIVIDALGQYEVPPDNIMATAPRRADGWWDRRTKAGREAGALFKRTQQERWRSDRDGRTQ